VGLGSGNGNGDGNLPWLHAPWTRILDGSRKGWFTPMDWHGISVSRLPAAAETTITMPLDWASVMEMENGGDVRGSLPTQLVPREG